MKKTYKENRIKTIKEITNALNVVANSRKKLSSNGISAISKRLFELSEIHPSVGGPNEAIISQHLLGTISSGGINNTLNDSDSNRSILNSILQGHFSYPCNFNIKSMPYCFGTPTEEILGETVKTFFNENEIANLKSKKIINTNNIQSVTSQTEVSPTEGKLSMALGIGTSQSIFGKTLHKPMLTTLQGGGVFSTLMESSNISSQLSEFFPSPCGFSTKNKSTISVQAKVKIGDPNKPFFLFAKTKPSPTGFLQAFGKISLTLMDSNGVEKVKNVQFLDAIKLGGENVATELSPTLRSLEISNMFEIEKDELPWVHVGVVASITVTRWWLTRTTDLSSSQLPEERGGFGFINLLDENAVNKVHPALQNAGAIEVSQISVSICPQLHQDEHALNI